MTYTTAKLGDVAEFIRGITFKPEDVVALDADDAVVCMRTKNVQALLDCDDLLAVPSQLVRRKDQYLQDGDILVSSANSWNLVGKCCWVPSLPWQAAFGGFISVLRGDSQRVDRRYLYWWFASERIQALLRSFGQKTTNISNLNIDRCRQLDLPRPPLPEQRRIAAILDKADALRTKRREALAQLDRLAQSIFVEMFGDPEEPTGQYPQTTLGELCRRVTDGTHQSPTWVSEGIPFLFISNIVNGKINFDTDKYISRETYEELTRRCPIEKGDVLYTTVGSYGNSAVVSGDEEFCFQRHIAHIKPDPAKLDSVFCAAMIESPGVRRQVDKVARGVAQKTVNLSDLKALKVFAPDLSVQRLFTQKIANLQRLKDQQLMGLAQSDDLFRAIQHRAFRGEL